MEKPQKGASEEITGYIAKGIGGFYYVRTPAGDVVECKPRGIFRKRGVTPYAGDNVRVVRENGAAVISEILPRKNWLVRPPLANIDLLFVVISMTEPVPNALVIDTLTAIAEEQKIQPVLVFTKTDLERGDEFRRQYEQTPYRCVTVDFETGEGSEKIVEMLQGKLCAFCGNSGVGKSTLLNRIAPQLERKTGAISLKLGRGKHTTREVEIFEIEGGRIADTPGFASLETIQAFHIPRENLQYDFPEFAPYLEKCRFTGCSHRGEKGCAVCEAVKQGEIAVSRYESYKSMYEAAMAVPEWEIRQK